MSAPIRTVVDLFDQAVTERPDKEILRAKVGGAWQRTTLQQWHDVANTWAKGLIALGVQPGDRVLLVAQTCREWVFADQAILAAGAVTVPVYPSAVADEATYVCENSGACVALVEDPTQLEKLVLQRDRLPDLRTIVFFHDVARLERPDAQGRTAVRLGEVVAAGEEGVLSLAQLTERGKAVSDDLLAQRRRGVTPEQACTIVYTSGTTGRPKGVVLTHAAFVYEVQTVTRALDVRPDDAVLLFLPLAHSFAKVVYVICIGVRTEMVIPRSIATVIQDMEEAAPTVVPSVPRVFEKAWSRIVATAEQAGPVKKRVFDWAMSVGREVSKLQQKGKKPTGSLAVRHQIAHRLVFQRIHERFGGRIRAFVSGGAPLSRELAEAFHACGLLILEGYGMTENCAAATVNRPDHYKLGSVGLPIEGVEVTTALDGEVLIRGPIVMAGYWRNPQATAQALQDGWLHTGDIGEVDADGFLYITDRKKDIIVTAGGKNVAPQNLEAHLKTSPFLSQVLVYGDRRKFLSALLTLDEDTLRAWADEQGIAYASTAELSQNAEVFRLIQAVVDEKNRTLASYETIKKFAILEKDFTVEDGDLTPSLKMRRREIIRKHQGLLDSFYSEHY